MQPDDAEAEAYRDQTLIDCLSESCDCDEWRWFRNEDNAYECRDCGLVVDA